MAELAAAVSRYAEAGETFPDEWIDEITDIKCRLGAIRASKSEQESKSPVCPQCKDNKFIIIDAASLNWTCTRCGVVWDKIYLSGWNDCLNDYGTKISRQH